MATMSAFLYHGFGVLWAGFYRVVEPELLRVGPYQGTLGCMEIPFGRGVCGAGEHVLGDVLGPHGATLLAGAPVVETRVCQYENTPHGDFLIDRHPDFENVWLVGGGSGHGFKHGPALGAYVAGKVTQADTELEPRFVLSAEGKSRRRLVY